MEIVSNSGPLISLARIDRLDLLPERRGRNIAMALGIPQTGTVGILLTAKKAGAIPALTPLLDDLIENGIRLSSRLYEEARRLAGE